MATGIDIALFEAANQLAGRSFTLDALMALAMESPLIKGGPLAACFLFVWWSGKGAEPERARRRKLLILTLLAAFLAAPVMKVVSTFGPVSPRPLVQAEQTVIFENGALTQLERVDYRPPQTGLAAKLAADASAGTVAPNELRSFPSDHAALYAAFAVGIFLALPGAGMVAMGWTLFVILLPRVATGMHWPSDMLAGILAGLGILMATVVIGQRLLAGPLGWLNRKADRHPGWAQAILFLLLLEVANAMTTLQRLVELAAGIVSR